MTNQTAIRFGYPQTLIREYGHWLVLLRPAQVTLGSLVLCAKSGATDFSAIPAAAFAEMGTVVADIERVLKTAFAYDKINYLMLMMVDPNVHFHVIPRYATERSACGLTLGDPGWPLAPQLGHAHELDPTGLEALRAHIARLF